MRETLKGLYSSALLSDVAEQLKQAYPAFDSNQFMQLIQDEAWEQEEFKQRIRHIAQALTDTLPSAYREALDILKQVAPHFRGVEYLFFADYVELNGLEDFEASMQALEVFTVYCTAEFAVRPFIMRDQERMLIQMKAWALSDNEHLRRLASEGSRPRLPWAPQLPALIADPKPVLPILAQLKEDPSLYVRKSVANHLNDISKDHPELVLDIAAEWYGHHPLTDWIVRHALRTLLRRGDVRALSIFGYEELDELPGLEITDLRLKRTVIAVGEELEFSFRVVNETGEPRQLRIDYEIDYMKQSGKHAPKRYKCSDKVYEAGSWAVEKRQSFKIISTRRFYAGAHRLHIVVNGKRLASADFVLEGAESIK
ncbi:DNA alkylation repair protein [Paenibacillus sp. FSL M8-0334]|uniref:DNA alkylation repair protein n=1 Tax=Paenibacillus campinasensis TaxID=66347 RepID=A0ABW9TCT4_9BACL|nr:DNA alkylation repair protein [Paenibacillus campinasensis]MUG68991.1 DNA alkylation repair protein [Paenibacillus campinasensis]